MDKPCNVYAISDTGVEMLANAVSRDAADIIAQAWQDTPEGLLWRIEVKECEEGRRTQL